MQIAHSCFFQHSAGNTCTTTVHTHWWTKCCVFIHNQNTEANFPKKLPLVTPWDDVSPASPQPLLLLLLRHMNAKVSANSQLMLVRLARCGVASSVVVVVVVVGAGVVWQRPRKHWCSACLK
ncbi:hypothetical protein E2C01_038153 [Portunus trituberculatus]|uniref:Uncharacterized protein n=1 Tax=Portunus trituberculatus TaxID=210409 RepID=A0A5B7FA35_PORTR|nr:hypothetical protein [Portunus trituberculatus]